MAEDQEKHECSHHGCNCPTEEGHAFCSDYCKTAGDTMEIACHCGHPDCSMQM